MKIMLIEDNDIKFAQINSHILSKGILQNDIIRAKTMTDFAANLNADIGLFIIDFMLPNIDDCTPTQNGKQILQTIVKSGKHDALLLAISSYPRDFPELREFYESRGCILADFSNDQGWKSTLDHLLIQLKKKLKYDFIIFCALEEERHPYITQLVGHATPRGGLDCFDIEINGKKGSVILLPKMGLVNAAVTASLCIDRYKPLVVGMSGICGGYKDNAKLGQLFISSMAYEYQSGKWASDGFKHEPYQVQTDNNTLTNLKLLANADGLIAELELGFSIGNRPTQAHRPEIGVFASGSAVIADQKYMDQIGSGYRKINVIDMEVFAVQRAAELSLHKPPCICAKTVVDLGDDEKNDNLHQYGSYISAKFLIKAIDKFFCQSLS